MKFSMTHNFCKAAEPEVFDETCPPDWLVSKDYNWWYEGYLMKLDVGESRKSDFRTITRIE